MTNTMNIEQQHHDDSNAVHTAIHLNNHGAWLVSVGDYVSAAQCLAEAFKYSRMVTQMTGNAYERGSSDEDAASKVYGFYNEQSNKTINQWMTLSRSKQQEDHRVHLHHHQEDQQQQAMLYRHPIYIPTSSSTPQALPSSTTVASYNFRLSLSVVLMFNLALVNQHLVTVLPSDTLTEEQQRTYIEHYHGKAVSLYELAYKLLAKFKSNVGNELVIMAITNNLAWSFDMLRQPNISIVHRQRLQSLVMLYLSTTATNNTNNNMNDSPTTSSSSATAPSYIAQDIEFFFTSSFIAIPTQAVTVRKDQMEDSDECTLSHQKTLNNNDNTCRTITTDQQVSYYFSCNPAAAA